MKFKNLLLGLGLAAIVSVPLLAKADLWYIQGNNLVPVIPGFGIKIPSCTGCSSTSTVTGNGTSTDIAFFSNSSNITSDNHLSYTSSTGLNLQGQAAIATYNPTNQSVTVTPTSTSTGYISNGYTFSFWQKFTAPNSQAVLSFVTSTVFTTTSTNFTASISIFSGAFSNFHYYGVIHPIGTNQYDVSPDFGVFYLGTVTDNGTSTSGWTYIVSSTPVTAPSYYGLPTTPYSYSGGNNPILSITDPSNNPVFTIPASTRILAGTSTDDGIDEFQIAGSALVTGGITNGGGYGFSAGSQTITSDGTNVSINNIGSGGNLNINGHDLAGVQNFRFNSGAIMYSDGTDIAVQPNSGGGFQIVNTSNYNNTTLMAAGNAETLTFPNTLSNDTICTFTTCLTSSTPMLSGTGTSTDLTLWTGTSTQSANDNLSFATSTGLAVKQISVAAPIVNFTNASGTSVLGVSSSSVVNIGGSSSVSVTVPSGVLSAGTCDSATTTIDSSYPTSTTGFAIGTQTDPGDQYYYKAKILSLGVLMAKVCAVTAGTPATTTLNIKIFK